MLLLEMAEAYRETELKKKIDTFHIKKIYECLNGQHEKWHYQ